MKPRCNPAATLQQPCRQGQKPFPSLEKSLVDALAPALPALTRLRMLSEVDPFDVSATVDRTRATALADLCLGLATDDGPFDLSHIVFVADQYPALTALRVEVAEGGVHLNDPTKSGMSASFARGQGLALRELDVRTREPLPEAIVLRLLALPALRTLRANLGSGRAAARLRATVWAMGLRALSLEHVYMLGADLVEVLPFGRL